MPAIRTSDYGVHIEKSVQGFASVAGIVLAIGGIIGGSVWIAWNTHVGQNEEAAIAFSETISDSGIPVEYRSGLEEWLVENPGKPVEGLLLGETTAEGQQGTYEIRADIDSSEQLDVYVFTENAGIASSGKGIPAISSTVSGLAVYQQE